MTFGINPLFAGAFWAAVLLGLLGPIIGRNLILARSVMLGLAVPQVALTGVAFVMLGTGLGWSWCVALSNDSLRAAIGALLFTIPALVLPVVMERRNEHSPEATLAVLYLAAIALANLMLSSNAFGEIYIEDLLHGRMLLINNVMLTLLGATLVTAAVVALVTRRRLLLVLTDPDFARACCMRVNTWRIGIAVLNGFVIGVGVAAVGPTVTFGFLILPVLMAATWSRSLGGHLVGSMLSGLVLAVAGFHLSCRYDLPMGDTIIGIGCATLIVSRLGVRLMGRLGRHTLLGR